MLNLLKENEFTMLESDWYWNQKDSALFYIFVDPKELPKSKIIKGPQTYGSQEHILAFKKKYARKKVWRQGYNYYAEIPRKLKKIADILRVIKKDPKYSNLKLLK